MKRLIFLLLIIPQICFAQTVISNHKIKQPSETKLFISANEMVSDFEDISASNNQITKYADVKTVNETSATNPKYFPIGNDKGIYFDGNYDKAYCADSTDFEIGSDDFTFDMWFRTSTLVGAGTNDYIAGKWQMAGNQREYGFILDENEKIVFYYSTNGATITTMSSLSAISINTWYHIAAVKSGTNIYLFVDGVLQETDTGISSVFAGTAQFQFGGWQDVTTDCMNGLLQNIRISREALWTANFTPPEINTSYTTGINTMFYVKGHDVAVNTVSFTDTATAKTITTIGDAKVGYSRGVASYFDGTGDYLSCPLICSNDYTKTTSVELWYYPTANNNTKILVARGHQTNGDFYLAAETQALTFRKFSTAGNTIYGASLASVFASVNKWYHIVAEYDTGATDSGVVNFWVNGVKTAVNKGSSTATYTANTGTTIGGYLATSPITGYITGLKVTEDNVTPYNTSNFTPPETEPVADQYTKLLLKQKMLKMPDIATNKTITISGQTIPRTYTKNGKYSLYFDGSDYISIAASADAYFDGDGTIDFWFYNTAGSNLYGHNADTSAFWRFTYPYNGGTIYFNYNTSQSINATMPAISKWTHFAATKSGTSIRAFINGVQFGTTASQSFLGSASQINYFGYAYPSSYITGYMQDIRIIKGRALWTSNFTPPRRSGAY